ncbi:hypothetical protein [Actinopolyspora mortivallis]|uniref:hypothetical protein n=1 Tax=Actinopolyspora mortivallis TaxID=33906 RepID=UPI000369217A|nr:hypothetical protein [Actinopolyspora mortivallis]
MRKVLVGVLAAVASMLFVPSAAYAGNSSAACSTEGRCGAYVTFDDHGEHLEAYDTEPDGHGVYVKYKRSDAPNDGEFTHRDGAGTWYDHNMSMPEGATIRFKVCRIDGSYIHNCSVWTEGTA